MLFFKAVPVLLLGVVRFQGSDKFAVLEREKPADDMPAIVYLDKIEASDHSTLCAAIAGALDSSQERAIALTEIGAVWLERETYRKESSSWMRYWPSTTKLDGIPRKARIYTKPRRFLACYTKEWSVLHEDAAYVIVDKPTGLPSQADNGNAVECVAPCAGRGLDLGDYLRPAHRLDTQVSGCLVLAKNDKAKRQFGHWLSRHKVTKRYTALTLHKRPPLGPLRHDMLVPKTTADRCRADELFGPGPRLLRSDRNDRGFTPGAWKPCKLVIHSATPFHQDNGIDCFEVDLTLVSGRPHQIRAQLAACDAPLAQDSLYAPGANAVLLPPLATSSRHEDFDAIGDNICNKNEVLPPPARSSSELRAPKEMIGLKATEISFAGRCASARDPPWWRRFTSEGSYSS